MGTIILRLISTPVKQYLWLLLLFCGITGLKAQTAASLQLDANTIESACADNGHVISIKVKGGQAPYTYTWQDGFEGSFRKDLPSGTYSCTVRDAAGAQATKQFIFQPQASALEISYQEEKNAGGSSITLAVKGGKAPYQYFWVGSGINTEAPRGKVAQHNLSNGVYQVIVQDANECSSSITVNVQ